ncbi:MAG TPA: hypothetical protein VKB67_04315 [Rhizomicrobium sp.]|nr:hypothetical protein [Rhizomicrobium sp.]
MNPLIAAAFSICAMHFIGPGYDPGFEKCKAIYNEYRAEQHDEVENLGNHWQGDLETVQKAVQSLGK